MPEIYRLTLPTPFPVGPVNSYVLTGDPLTLVDPGPAYPPAREALARGLAGLGLSPADFKLVFLTHPHIDHYGLAREVVEQSGARVVAHAEAAPRLASGIRRGTTQAEQDALKALLARAGVPGEVTRSLFRQWTQADGLATTVGVDLALEDGAAIKGGGVTWRALATPGHSPAALCFHDEAGRRLISGDHLLPEISSNAIMEFREVRPDEAAALAAPAGGVFPAGNGKVLVREKSLLIYIASLRRVQALDLAEVLPGHGEPFTGHKALIAERLERVETRKSAIAAILKDRGPSTAFCVAMRLFPEQDQAMGQFLALSEALGHLDLLEAEGRVRLDTGGEADLYRLA